MSERYNRPPPHGTIRPPLFPPRPDLYDEVEWGPELGLEDARLAYRFWFLPDTMLDEGLPPPRFLDADDEAKHALARNVYNHLMEEHLVPVSPTKWREKWEALELHKAVWSFDTIFNDQGFDLGDIMEGPNLVEGQDIDSMRVLELREMLRKRNLSTEGKSRDLRQRLRDYKQSVYRKFPRLPRSSLSDWGIARNDENRHSIEITDEGIGPLDMYTCAILTSPYNPAYWLSRAYCHYQQAFFDLAIGDVYRAQMLCEVLINPAVRNQQPGLYSRVWQAIEQHFIARGKAFPYRANAYDERFWMRHLNGINNFVPTLRKAIQNLFSLSLAAVQSWEDYKIKENELLERLIMPARDTEPFHNRMRVMRHAVLGQNINTKETPEFYFYEKSAGTVLGDRKYPYDADDKDRSTNGFVDRATELFITNNDSLPWKKCKVDVLNGVANNTQLGIFATDAIAAGDILFAEMPAMRSHLDTYRLVRALDTNQTILSMGCDNCKADIPPNHSNADISAYNDREFCVCSFYGGTRLKFCPQPNPNYQTCAQNARERYHFRVCKKNWGWLHAAMKPNIHKTKKETRYYSHTNEKHATVLSLLLREVFDITLHRRETNPHLLAHEIDELLVLESHQDWDMQSFPFTLAANIQVPFDILMQLGVNIFRDLSFDTWVIQLVLRKLTVNAVPWDHSLRQPTKIVNEKNLPYASKKPRMPEEEWNKIPPTFYNLYLYPGFSLFNHACFHQENAFWGYDPKVPNRVLMWAARPIKKGEEIRIPYFDRRDSRVTETSFQRVVGQPCNCPGQMHACSAQVKSVQNMVGYRR
ncbi:hypothetical protein BO71DRAFT_254746 [Aspergillus ellipticus CBS 707.79]|uniref:Histone-lysine N-methyltransferase SET5 n=1 Tax=Aspergillus ellipticus CBS 707.79 TaxID=1448320 RepID=A0A319DGV0_9EURO|nr:hypothetical protein BO71DRAFT_254746 [Aspergillus ellipticus CBS 707.79]